jgi:hypothetical protein
VAAIEKEGRGGVILASSGSKHMRESTVSRTLVPDEAAPTLPLLGLRAPAREEMEAGRASAATVEEAPRLPPPVAASGEEKRAASSARRRVRFSKGGAIFGERSSWSGELPPRELKREGDD